MREVPAPLAPAVASSFGLPDNFTDQMRLAEIVAKSDLVDKKLQGKPENVFMVVQKAIGLNISFDMAIAKTHVIDNKVSPSAELLRILLRRAGHDLEIIELTDKLAKGVLTLSHRRSKPITMEFSIAKAQAAGYTNKPLWKSDPESMLVAALTRRMVRFHCPEVAAGLDLSDDLGGAEFGVVDAPAPTSSAPVKVEAQRVVDEPAPAPDPKAERAQQVLEQAIDAKNVATLTRLGKEARSEDLLDQIVHATDVVSAWNLGEELTLKDALMHRLHELESGTPAAT